MSEPVIAREVALDMVAAWAGELETDAPDVPHVIRAIMSGRLDRKDDAFDYRLASPLRLDNGESVTSITITEPDARILRDASKGNRDNIDTTLRMLAALSSQPLAVIERVKMRDITALGELLDFFA